VCLRFSSWVRVVTPNSCSILRGFLMGARLGWASGVPKSVLGNGVFWDREWGFPLPHVYVSV
jgi:hypothetical protein